MRRRLITRSRATLVGALAVATLGAGCAREKAATTGRVTQMGADRYIERAVGQSSEGVVLMPSEQAERQYDRVRLAEIAQNMRRPMAVCFLERAITTMELGEIDGEPGYVHVPQGQIKVRARLNTAGNVLKADVLDSAFEDVEMEDCVVNVVSETRFPETRSQTPHWVDVVYWVSLGSYQGARTEEFEAHLRRQEAEAAVRGKTCFEGRVPPGEYEVHGLSLFDREGGTLINRVDRGGLDADVSRCVAQAFKAIRIPAEKEAFVRPVRPTVVFQVAEDGKVSFEDERWLELVRLEERARREERKAELTQTDDEPPGPIDVERDAVSGLVVDDEPEPGLDDAQQGPRREPSRDAKPAPRPPKTPKADDAEKISPGESGLKLDLGSRATPK